MDGAIGGITGNAANDVKIIDSDKVGFAGLTADTFVKLLITQLQNQDPTEPVSNQELLDQLATMRNLQSNIELGDALKSITTNQQLSTATNFIGKAISGTTTNQEPIDGIVTRAFLRDGDAFVGVGNSEVPLNNILSVEQIAA